jgi:hypothetical protein
LPAYTIKRPGIIPKMNRIAYDNSASGLNIDALLCNKNEVNKLVKNSEGMGK